MDVGRPIPNILGTFRKISKSVHTSKSVNEMLDLAVRTTGGKHSMPRRSSEDPESSSSDESS